MKYFGGVTIYTCERHQPKGSFLVLPLLLIQLSYRRIPESSPTQQALDSAYVPGIEPWRSSDGTGIDQTPVSNMPMTPLAKGTYTLGSMATPTGVICQLTICEQHILQFSKTPTSTTLASSIIFLGAVCLLLQQTGVTPTFSPICQRSLKMITFDRRYYKLVHISFRLAFIFARHNYNTTKIGGCLKIYAGQE